MDEVHLLGRLDRGHDEGAAAVVLLQVDGEAEVDVGRLDEGGLAVLLGEAVVHLRHERQGLDHGVADEVREADLAAARAGQVVVDDDAVVDEQLGRDGAHARRGRDGERDLHVGDDARGRAAQRGHDVLVDRAGALDGGDVARLRGLGRGLALGLGLRLGLGLGWARPRVGLRRGCLGRGCLGRSRAAFGLGTPSSSGWCWRRRGRGRHRWSSRSADPVPAGALVVCGLRRRRRRRAARGRARVGLTRPVVLEEPPPGLVDRRLVGQELLVELVDEPFVRPECCNRVTGRGLIGHGECASFVWLGCVVAYTGVKPRPECSRYRTAARMSSPTHRRGVRHVPGLALGDALEYRPCPMEARVS